jgi:hypothetical protein
MRKGFYVLLLAAFAGTGCFALPHIWDSDKPPAKSTPKVEAAPPAREVSPEQVNDSNARQMADKLQQEVDQDAQAPVVTQETKSEGKNKGE